ncbi:MAG TPA: copper resistance protein CopC [Chloroflexota bacterium]|nr:copper resistance protein CopC [Chloroflexota bacterium]
MRIRYAHAATGLVAALGSVLALPGVAGAHATLVHCNVARDSRLTAAPKTLSCIFAEGVQPKGSFVDIVAGDDGGVLNPKDSQVSFSNPKEMDLPLPKLNKGTYGILWFTISADDGHKAGGYFTFIITK